MGVIDSDHLPVRTEQSCLLAPETEVALNKQKDDTNLNVKGLSGAQVYGQGMTVSAMEAEALHNLLKVRPRTFTRTAWGHTKSALAMMIWLFLK